jgi:alpha-1,6-mannosyltransferase
MIRTLHVTNAWHPTSGGVRTFYEALLARAARDGRQMSVIVPGERTATSQLAPGCRLHTIAAPRSPVMDHRYRLMLPHRYLWIDRGDLWRIIREERPQLIEVCDKFALCHLAGLIKRRQGPRPTVVGLSQERLDDGLRAHLGESRGYDAFAAWYLARVYLRQFDAHVANSYYTAGEILDVIEAHGPRKPLLWRLRERVHVLPLGVDTDVFRPALRSSALREALLRRAGGRADSRLVVFAGRLSTEKHVQWLVPAIRALVARGGDVRLVIAGGGPLERDIAAAAAAQTPGRVAMVGHVATRAELAAMVASADVFVHPNPREPFGIGPLEAMAAGVPLVAPRSGGVLTYATDDNAWLADPSPEGLAAAADAALTQSDRACARSARALLTARALAWPNTAGRYLRQYDDIHAARLARGVEPWSARAYRGMSTPLTTS